MPDLHIIGVDLGQTTDPTALAIVRRSARRDDAGMTQYHFLCNYLQRFPLRTPYPAIVLSVVDLLGRPELGQGARLVVDGTGVGRPVLEMFPPEVRPVLTAITITAGDAIRKDMFAPQIVGYWAPKRELSSAVQACLQSGRLRFARDMNHADELKAELLNFQVRVTPAAHEQFGTWRSGQHDDLVLALACAVWYGLQDRELPPNLVGGGSWHPLLGEIPQYSNHYDTLPAVRGGYRFRP